MARSQLSGRSICAAVADHLPENAVLIAQTIANGRVLERGERVDEAGREPPQATVAESCIGLFLDHRI